MGSKQADRFTWERAILDPKVGVPRDLLCMALLLATYSTGKTGGDIKVSEATLRDVLGYDHERSVRRLVAELRDGYCVIRRIWHGNQYSPAKYALVLPDDLAERSEAARDSRAADRARASRQPKADRAPDAERPEQDCTAPDAERPVQEGEHRTQRDRAPDAERSSTGRTASPYQEDHANQAPAARQKASERLERSGAVVNRSVEGDPGAAPDPAENGQARLAEQEARKTTTDPDLSDENDDHEPGAGQCQFCKGWYHVFDRGLIGKHAGPWHDGQPTGTCPGAKLEPVSPVVCARCGRGEVPIKVTTGLCNPCDRDAKRAERAEIEARHQRRER